MSNLTRTVVDPLLEIVRNGAGGAVVAAVFARMPVTAPRGFVRT